MWFVNWCWCELGMVVRVLDEIIFVYIQAPEACQENTGIVAREVGRVQFEQDYTVTSLQFDYSVLVRYLNLSDI